MFLRKLLVAWDWTETEVWVGTRYFRRGPQIGLAKLAENGKKRAAETDLMKRRT